VDSRDDRDELDDYIAERARRNSEFPALVDAHLQRRRLQRALAGKRQELGISQTEVAKRMSTSQSAVARIEAGEIDAKVSTLQRYALAIGFEIEFSLRPAS
jgi:ribosome-binding protein aMBF1 (putative translation factor)